MSDQNSKKVDNLKLIQLKWDIKQFAKTYYYVSVL